MARVEKHIGLLDGLRGVAAAAVVVYHFSGRSALPAVMPRGYLAVDFFFVLSGYVLAHAYAARLRGELRLGQFIALRLVRLLPMLLPGTLFGALMEFWRPGTAFMPGHVVQVLGLAVLGCLALPWPFTTSLEQTIFPINGPVWSLFCEMVANLAFVLALRSRFPRPAVIGLMLVGGVWLAAYGLDKNSLDVGAHLTDWTGGLPRACYSFFAGVLVFAYGRRVPALPAIVLPCLLIAIFMIPRGAGARDVLLDLGLVLVVFPLLIGAAAHGSLRGAAARLSRWAGDISYPMYLIHYPIVRAVCFLGLRHGLGTRGWLLLLAGTFLAIVLLSWLAFAFYDRPVRRFLTRQMRQRNWSGFSPGPTAISPSPTV